MSFLQLNLSKNESVCVHFECARACVVFACVIFYLPFGELKVEIKQLFQFELERQHSQRLLAHLGVLAIPIDYDFAVNLEEYVSCKYWWIKDLTSSCAYLGASHIDQRLIAVSHPMVRCPRSRRVPHAHEQRLDVEIGVLAFPNARHLLLVELHHGLVVRARHLATLIYYAAV